MKFLAFLLLALLSLVSSVSVSEGMSGTANPPEGKLEQRILLEDSDAWQPGTDVYYEWHGKWYEGTITNYFDGVYTVTWEHDEIEYFDDLNVVDKMVRAAVINEDPNLLAIGTRVIDDTTADGVVWTGMIVDYVDGQYRIEWDNDGSVDAIGPGSELDTLVQAAQAQATPSPTEKAEVAATEAPTVAPTPSPTASPTASPTVADTEAPTSTRSSSTSPPSGNFAVGTEVYKYFEDDGWYWGTITWFDDGVYSIRWSDDSTETYDSEAAVEVMVKKARRHNRGDEYEDDPWDNGTAVFIVFPDGPWFGEIIDYKEGIYTVRFSDDTVFQYDVDETNRMVQAAYERVQEERAKAASANAAGSKNSEESSSKTFLILALVVVGAVVGGVVYRKRRTGIEVSSSSSAGTTDNNLAPASYKDEPDAELKVEPLPDVI